MVITAAEYRLIKFFFLSKKVVQLLYHFLHHQCGVPVCWEAEGLGELECC